MSSEQSAYNCYRSVIKSIRSGPGSRDTRSSAIKQKALKIAADRYHIRIGDLKRIVRKFDEDNGISHDHTENYLKQLEIERIFQETQLLYSDDDMICSVCGNDSPEHFVRLRLDNDVSEESNGSIIKFSPIGYMCS